MGLKLNRKKERNLKLSILSRLNRLIPLGSDIKLKLYLDLAWIFSRLAHEISFKSALYIPNNYKNNFLIDGINPDSKVLDIGCGQGSIIEQIISKTTNILGVDYMQASIDIAKEKLGNKVTLICDDIFNYLKEKPNTTFDIIILSHVLEHIDQPEAFLKKVSNTAQYFYIEVPDFESSHLNIFRQHINTDLVYSDADHVSEFDRNELQGIIESAGLEVQQAQFIWGVMKFWCVNPNYEPAQDQ